ncbi:hypothetical protein IWW38_003232 [Coemansia aciculifera]|uniref:Uncharacterized protein n=1 Tax=Coemansia aciculifera TaxID=417176 RepID=A0ACC1M214_9FUNG|nr:hypothetical protein IWW38_003232 [Coemansia aciculifera]
MAPRTPKKAIVFIANGTEEMEAVITIDVLRRAGIHVLVLAAVDTSTDPVVCSRGVKLVPDAYLGDDSVKIATYDAVVVPGGAEGATTLAENPQVCSILADFYAQKKLVAAICAGPLVVKAAGIQAKAAQPLRLTSHPLVKDKLDHDYLYKDERVVVDGNLVTSRGPGTSFEFALKLVSLLAGDETMNDVAAPMMLA